MIRRIAALLILGILFSFPACSRDEPEKHIDDSDKQEEQIRPDDKDSSNNEALKGLYDPGYFADLDSHEKLEEREIVADNSAESKFVLAEAERVVKDYFSYSDIKAKEYKLFGVFSIDIGAVGLNGGVKIYRVEYGLVPENDADLLASGNTAVFDGTYFRFENASYLVAAFDDEGYKTIGVVSDKELRDEYSSKELLDEYISPYRAAAIELYDRYGKADGMSPEGHGYEELFGSEDKISAVRTALIEYYKGKAKINEIIYDSYCIYDEASYAAYKASIEKERSDEPEDLFYIVSYDLGGGSEIALAEIPASEFRDCDFEVVMRIMNLTHPEVSLRIDPYGFPYGPGSNAIFFGFPVNEEPKIEKQNWDPVWSEGSYWFTVDYKDFNAVCYFSSPTNQDFVNSITTSRTDVQTYRGIRVGDSVEELKKAYPELNILDKKIYPDEYKGDVYFYSPINEYGFYLNLIFYCDNDQISTIKVINYFD